MSALADWLARQERSHPSAIDLGLTRVREVARRLQLLEPAHRVITVAGTNGKGSTVAFLDSLLRAAGLRVGRFTSPHLTRYNERICIDDREAADAALVAAFERIEAARGDISLTFFEYNTLAALELFARAPVDVAVLEVGLGGRLDATNILDADVGVVTSIGLDHVEWLGNTTELIGREKAGIFRAGRPAVLGSPSMPQSISTVIQSLGARRVQLGVDFFREAKSGRWDFVYREFALRGLPPPALPGHLQLDNAATALAALIEAGFASRLSHSVVSQGLREASIRGRFQILPGEVEWVLDVAHNPAAAEVLRANLGALPRRRTLAVCGVLGDKDIAGITAVLAPLIEGWVLTRLEGPRAVPPETLATHLPTGATVVGMTADVHAACRAARDAASPGDRILVFGSFLTVGPALDFLGI